MKHTCVLQGCAPGRAPLGVHVPVGKGVCGSLLHNSASCAAPQPMWRTIIDLWWLRLGAPRVKSEQAWQVRLGCDHLWETVPCGGVVDQQVLDVRQDTRGQIDSGV